MNKALLALDFFNFCVMDVCKKRKEGIPYGGPQRKMEEALYRQIRIIAAKKAAMTKGRHQAVNLIRAASEHDFDDASHLLSELKRKKDKLELGDAEKAELKNAEAVLHSMKEKAKEGEYKDEDLLKLQDALNKVISKIDGHVKNCEKDKAALKKKLTEVKSKTAQDQAGEPGGEDVTEPEESSESNAAKYKDKLVSLADLVAGGARRRDVFDKYTELVRNIGAFYRPVQERMKAVQDSDLKDALKQHFDAVSGKASEANLDVRSAFSNDDTSAIVNAIRRLAVIIPEIDEWAQKVNSAHISEGTESPDTATEPVEDADEDSSVESQEEASESHAPYRYAKAPLSTAPWEGQIEEIEKGLKSNETSRKVNFTAENVNASYRDTLPDGRMAITKPEYLGYSIEYLRPFDKNGLRPEIPCGVREVLAFELDRVLGLGVVPPTVYKRTVLKGDLLKKGLQKAEEAESFGDHYHNLTVAPGLHDVFERTKQGRVEGSSQSFVDDAEEFRDLSRYNKLNDTQKFDLIKIAVFDYISGNLDRHLNNMLCTKDNVVAIDQGLCFPVSSKKAKSPGHLKRLRSRAFKLVLSKMNGVIPDTILEQLATVDEKQFMRPFRKRKMLSEGKGAWARLQNLLQMGEFSDNMADEVAF